MERGYLALWRKFQDHEFWQEAREFSKAEAWIDILWSAQHNTKPQQVVIGMGVFTCNYGECLKSVRTWAKRWSWTESKVRRFLKLLKNMNQIQTKSEGVTTRIIVTNFAIYDPRRRASDSRATHERLTSDSRATTDNTVKTVKTVKNNPPIVPPKKKKRKPFVPPSKDEVVEYFKLNGYSEDIGEKAWRYYNEADWHDTKGNKVRNWKQKMLAVWFKPENKEYNPVEDYPYGNLL